MKANGHVNKKHLKSYLRLLYIINNRKPFSFYGNKSGKSSNIVSQFFINLILSIPMMMIFILVKNFTIALFVNFIILMVMFSFIFILEYSSILFDNNDNKVLSFRPINDRTVFLGRIIYIVIVALLLGLSLSLLPFVYLLITKGGCVCVSYLLAVITTVLFSVLFSLFIYMLLMRLLGGERLNKYIIIIQVVITIGVFIFSNLAGMFLKNNNLNTTNIFSDYWSLLCPSAWETSIVNMFYFGNYSSINISLSSMAIVVPVGLGIVLYKFLASSFKQDILNFDIKTNKKSSKFRFSFANIFTRIFTNSTQEANIFKVIYKIIHRDAKFMMSVFSLFTLIIILVGMTTFLGFNMGGGLIEEVSNFMLIYFIYNLSLVFVLASQKFSIGDFKSVSERYRVSPLDKPGIVKVATIKVLNCKIFIPILVISSIVIHFIWGLESVLSLITVYFIMNINIGQTILSGKSKFPLSLSKVEAKNNGKAFKGMFLMGICGCIHYKVLSIPFGVFTYTIVVAIVYFMMMRKYRKLQWSDFM